MTIKTKMKTKNKCVMVVKRIIIKTGFELFVLIIPADTDLYMMYNEYVSGVRGVVQVAEVQH